MQYRIFTDGGSRGNPGQAAVGVVVWSQDEIVFQQGLAIGVTTNNVAEYRAVLFALDWLTHQNEQPDRIDWYLDSKLVVEQLSRRWKIKDAKMLTLANQVWQKLTKLGCPSDFYHIPRAKNAQADSLVNQALDQLPA